VAGPDTIERAATNGTSVLADALLSNDSDADNDPFLFTSFNPTSGAGDIVSSSNNWIYYTPPAGFTNADTFTYTISDV
jgi:Bacterial Ig domain